MTVWEGLGAVVALVGALGIGIITVDWLRERGKPAHNHEEGNGGPDCLRCQEDLR